MPKRAQSTRCPGVGLRHRESGSALEVPQRDRLLSSCQTWERSFAGHWSLATAVAVAPTATVRARETRGTDRPTT